jgi:hypothetical protein
MSRSAFARRLICAATWAGVATAGSAALAAPASFSFRSVEFLPADQRQPAAEAFMQRTVVQGMPLAQAVAALRSAGAYCHAPRAGVVSCIHASTERHVGHDLTDVIWRIRLTAPQGAVTAATLRRTTAGV